jgi:hypothetical protein
LAIVCFGVLGAFDFSHCFSLPWFSVIERAALAGCMKSVRAAGHLFELQRPDGVILATSNALHMEHTLACIEAHMAALIEKPLAYRDDVDPVRTIRRAVILEVL